MVERGESDIAFLRKVDEGSKGRPWASNNVDWTVDDPAVFRRLRAEGLVEGPDKYGHLQVRLTLLGRDALKEHLPIRKVKRFLAQRATNALDVGLGHLITLALGFVIGFSVKVYLEDSPQSDETQDPTALTESE